MNIKITSKFQLTLILFSFLTFFVAHTFAAQKAKIIGDFVEVYVASDFDSEQIDEVFRGETYQVSDKNYGPFYRIKLKNGKIGYIVDYELNIAGKGPLKPQDLDEIEALEFKNKNLIKDVESLKNDNNTNDDESALFGRSLGGPSLQFFNYHEDTMGSEQIANLIAIGYKSVGLTSWSVAGTWQVPSYYTTPTDYKAQGLQLWADFGFSNTLGQFANTDLRLGANIMTHISIIQLETPTRRFDLHDVTLGANLELALTFKFKKTAFDTGIKYYFDKSKYAALGVSVLF